MLVQTKIAKTPTVTRLTHAWAMLYIPDFQALPLQSQPTLARSLLEANSPEGRSVTTAKLNERIIHLQSEVASIQTSSFYVYISDIMHLAEVRRLAEASFQIFKRIIQLYQQDALGLGWMPAHQQATPVTLNAIADRWTENNIETLAQALEPVLLEFQFLHQQSPDWRSLGFLTTQLNFCNQWLVRKLTDCERVLIEPYLRFSEEQVAQPWQRACAAAVAYEVNHPLIATVEQMMLRSPEIADATLAALIQQCPHHTSRRGSLSNPEVRHSCLRDLKMFQAYLCLCVLEDNLGAIEQELLELCLRVMPSVGVKWELTKVWTQTLMTELLRHLDATQQAQVLPYTTRMQEIFLNAKAQFEAPPARSFPH